MVGYVFFSFVFFLSLSRLLGVLGLDTTLNFIQEFFLYSVIFLTLVTSILDILATVHVHSSC